MQNDYFKDLAKIVQFGFSDVIETDVTELLIQNKKYSYSKK